MGRDTLKPIDCRGYPADSEQHQRRNRPAWAGTRMPGGVRAGGREPPGYSILSINDLE